MTLHKLSGWRSRGRVFVLAALAVALSGPTASGQGSPNDTVAVITGTVKSAQGQAIQGASVRVDALNYTAGTGASGTFRINVPRSRVQSQVVTLLVRAIGYRPQSRQITIAPGAQSHEITLDADVNRVSEVSVTGSQGDTARTARGKQLAFSVDRAGNVDTPSSTNFSQHLFPPELIMQHQSRLRMRDVQRDSILREISRLQATATQAQWQIADESTQLNELLGRDRVSESEVLARADRMMSFETSVKRAQLQMLVRIRNLLTEEQREILRTLRRD
jgi:hypothetical protein